MLLLAVSFMLLLAVSPEMQAYYAPRRQLAGR